MSLQCSSCAHGILGIPHGEVRDTTYMAYEKYKGLRDAHPIVAEYYTKKQIKHIEHVNNVE